MRILLGDLAHTHSVSSASLTMPLGIGYVKAHAVEALGTSVDIGLFKHPERFLAAVHDERPAVVGLANYGWNENLNRQIGRHVRRLLPDTLIVAGGPNIDPDPERRLAFLKKHDYLDGLIIDGGEEPFTELIIWHRDTGRDLNQLPSNVVWRDGDSLVTTQERPLKKVIEHLPSPYIGGYLDEFLHEGLIPLFETNRGCPFLCTFCAWGSASKNMVRRVDLEQVLAEIEYVGRRSDARHWIICDANFGILPRDLEIARAVRAVKDQRGRPVTCDIWLAKNVTDRCLAIGEVLGDMAVPVMAVQSMDQEVLKYIKRSNISLNTYEQYQQKFHRIGSRTYSDLIVPLPAETLATHLAGLRTLMSLGVDIIQSHNMRLLAGAETNSTETRERFEFRTACRLIHGDAGVYRATDGEQIRAFEYEESLRSTNTMSEEELFYLRKLHFLIDFCWNIEVYKPLLKLGLLYEISPVDVLVALLDHAEQGRYAELQSFFVRFDDLSHAEWFASADAIETYFEEPSNFERLLNREFEKLNIQFAVVALRDYKRAFDAAIADGLSAFDRVPHDIMGEVQRLAFALFPPLEGEPPPSVEISSNLLSLNGRSLGDFKLERAMRAVSLSESPRRRELRETITAAEGITLSKVLNTQGISLRELQLNPADGTRVDQAFRAAV